MTFLVFYTCISVKYHINHNQRQNYQKGMLKKRQIKQIKRDGVWGSVRTGKRERAKRGCGWRANHRVLEPETSIESTSRLQISPFLSLLYLSFSFLFPPLCLLDCLLWFSCHSVSCVFVFVMLLSGESEINILCQLDKSVVFGKLKISTVFLGVWLIGWAFEKPLSE